MKWPNLIPDWKRAWQFLSVQAALLLALLSGLQAEVLPLVSPLFPAPVWPWVSGGLALVVVLLRLVAQPGLVSDRHAMAEPFYENREDFQRDMNRRAMREAFYKSNEDFRRDVKQAEAVTLSNATVSSSSDCSGSDCSSSGSSGGGSD